MPSRRVPAAGLISESERRLLQGLYTNGPAAFGSIKSLVKASGLSVKKVKEFLHSNNAYTKHHVAVRKFERQRVYPRFVNDIWCGDLAQVDKLASDNNGIQYLLVIVDVLSRFVYVEPIKNKLAVSAKNAFVKIITRSGTQPKYLWTDDGKEFAGAFKTYCNNMGIRLYHTFSDKKAAYAEKAIQSLKNILYRYLEERNTWKYHTKLQSFVKTMNARTNRSIGMAPKDVQKEDMLGLIYRRLPLKYRKPKFKAGDYVRISKKDMPFRKGYKAQFTDEIFKVIKLVNKLPNTYMLQDKDKNIIKGQFYEKELILYTV